MNHDDVEKLQLAGLGNEERFCRVEQSLRQRLVDARRDAEERATNQFGVPTSEFGEYDYAVSVSAAAIEYGMTQLSDFELPWPTNDSAEVQCRMFRARATQLSQQLLFRHAARNDPNTVAFDSTTREKLRFHLSQLRAVIKKDLMPDWQKQEWFEAIATLEAQIEKSRTALVAFLDIVGKAITGSVPFAEAVGKLLSIAQEAKAVEAARAMLGAPVVPKQIEGPKTKQLPAPKTKSTNGGFGSGFDKALDDEIPF